MIKKFICDMSVSKTNKILTHSCKPCYEEKDKHSSEYKEMINLVAEYNKPELLPVIKENEDTKLLFIFNDQWKYVAEGIIIDNNIPFKNIGGGGNSLKESLELVEYIEKENAFEFNSCYQYNNYYDEL